ncbi:MAG: sulfotransferase domain-containing protein, partial [Candidatus Hermodarchaeota archaeon]
MKKDREFVERGFYFKQLKDYIKLFPRENILIVFFEDLQKTPVDFIQKIYNFLNVKDTNYIPSKINQKKNITGQYVVKNKLPFINTLIYWTHLRLDKNGALRKLLNKFRVEELLNNLMNFNKKRIRSGNIEVLSIEPLKQSTRDYLLNEIYKEDILNLEKLLNIDLSFWH